MLMRGGPGTGLVCRGEEAACRQDWGMRKIRDFPLTRRWVSLSQGPLGLPASTPFQGFPSPTRLTNPLPEATWRAGLATGPASQGCG